jgi:hypothetical protein
MDSIQTTVLKLHVELMVFEAHEISPPEIIYSYCSDLLDLNGSGPKHFHMVDFQWKMEREYHTNAD